MIPCRSSRIPAGPSSRIGSDPDAACANAASKRIGSPWRSANSVAASRATISVRPLSFIEVAATHSIPAAHIAAMSPAVPGIRSGSKTWTHPRPSTSECRCSGIPDAGAANGADGDHRRERIGEPWGFRQPPRVGRQPTHVDQLEHAPRSRAHPQRLVSAGGALDAHDLVGDALMAAVDDEPEHRAEVGADDAAESMTSMAAAIAAASSNEEISMRPTPTDDHGRSDRTSVARWTS